MADIIPTDTTTSAPVGTAGLNLSTTTKKAGDIGKDDFLKLLVGQLQHQDPMQPSDDNQFIGQMAQFSQLEQETNNAQTSTQIATMLSHAGALSLMGRTVSYIDDDKAPQSGVVEQVDVASDGIATLTVGGKSGVTLAAVTQVR
jgi:flagellar basal-body rod modification protein FlgD